MSLDSLRMGVLILMLVSACVTDARGRCIPNTLTFPALLMGLVLAAAQGGLPRLGLALGGIAVASVALLAYAGRMLGAGDVKLLCAVGALTGPRFAGFSLLGAALTGGLLAFVWTLCRRGPRLPYAPAIAGGVALTAWLLHGVGP
jgi:prepilin peptidase CpaA